MSTLRFDFNNMFDKNVGRDNGVTAANLSGIKNKAKKAHAHLKAVLAHEKSRVSLGLEWTRLPMQSEEIIEAIERMADEIASSYENVISLGIGGSYLGLKAAQDALRLPYYNEFSSVRGNRPKIYFDGNNLDPETLSVLLDNLDPKKTFVIVISKSGETTETKAAFMIVESWLKKAIGKNYGRQIIAITDPKSGALRSRVHEEESRDPSGFRSFPVMKGVGGRFSELNIGLLHMAIIGIDVREVLRGARSMYGRCMKSGLLSNPALLYAALHTVLYKRKGKSIAVMMPFSECLKSTADWYVQLLAESLGKKYGRRIKTWSDKTEVWEPDHDNVLNVGRTPIPARGTNDLHSIQQNNIEGENNKVTTFIRVEKFRRDIRIPGSGDILSGRSYSKLMGLAQEATEWALVRESRPNCTVIMPEISPFHWGELLIFFEMATAYEGEFLNINAFDQPGVEGYKNYMYYKLRKPGMPEELVRDMENHPLKKAAKYIL